MALQTCWKVLQCVHSVATCYTALQRRCQGPDLRGGADSLERDSRRKRDSARADKLELERDVRGALLDMRLDLYELACARLRRRLEHPDVPIRHLANLQTTQ
jgi:hypothetical protein